MVSVVSAPPLSGHSPASRDISRKGQVLPEYQKLECSRGVEAKSFKFLRKRPRAHAGGTHALLAEESLKNDGGEGTGEEKEKREKKKCEERVLSS